MGGLAIVLGARASPLLRERAGLAAAALAALAARTQGVRV
jgi:hypothetical protein